MKTLRAAAQDGRVAGLEAQRRRVGRHVGPALVDDANDTQRHRDSLNLQTIRSVPFSQDASKRVMQAGDRFDAAGHALDAIVIQHQAVEQGCTQAALLARRHILRVGCQDSVRTVANCSRCRKQRSVALFISGQRECRCRLACSRTHRRHDILDGCVLLQLNVHARTVPGHHDGP